MLVDVEPGIGNYEPDGGSLGLATAGKLKAALDEAAKYMLELVKESGKPVRLCLTMPHGVRFYQDDYTGDVIFPVYDPKSGGLTSQRIFYFVATPHNGIDENIKKLV
jgi:hypothetical protein